MLTLILHVLSNSLQILGSKTYHAISYLPFEQFASAAEFSVDHVQRNAF
jgi:hypothetical protein